MLEIVMAYFILLCSAYAWTKDTESILRWKFSVEMVPS